MRLVSSLARLGRRLLLGLGGGALVVMAMRAAGCPILLDRLVIEVDQPAPASAVVCVGAGLSGDNPPLLDGWDRIYTAVQLHADGFAPMIVFSGGGTEAISEAEVYAEAARWLGGPEEAIVLDPGPRRTSEHPYSLLDLSELEIRRDTPLLVVTSRLHSKRVALTFRKAGYTDVRVIADYEARGPGRSMARSLRRSRFATFEPSGRMYDDPVNRLRWGLDRLLTTVRELVAIAVYKMRGEA